MKKYTFVCILALSFQIIGFSQSFNYEQKQNNTSMLLGKINKEALSQEPHSNWFTKNYNQYTPDTETISSLPTIIIYKNGKEINRIVESPVTRLEQDLLQSIQGNYTPNHHIVTLANQLLEEEGIEKFLKKSKKHIKELQKHAHKTNQLNTYANVLFYAGQTQKALAILTFNTMLFPKDAKTYMSLGNKQSKVNQLQEALESYQKALALEPNNKKIRVSLHA